MVFYNPTILIGKDVATLTVSPTPATLQAGEIMFVKKDMTELAAGEDVTDSEYIYMVQGTENLGRPIWSPKITGIHVQNYSGYSYAADVQQVTHVGNVGSGGLAIVVNNSTEYELTLNIDSNTNIYSQRPNFKRFHYTSDATATQAEIAAAFVAQINADPYVSQYITALAVSSGGNSGIRLTGKTPSYTFRLPADYAVLRFSVSTNLGFDTTPVTLSTNPKPGKGTYKQVAEAERKWLGNRGVTNHLTHPAPGNIVTLYTVPSETYDNYIITCYDQHNSHSIEQTWSQDFHQIHLYLPAGASTLRTYVEAALNPWMATAGPGSAGFAAVTL